MKQNNLVFETFLIGTQSIDILHLHKNNKQNL